jgi:hypothetical protein
MPGYTRAATSTSSWSHRLDVARAATAASVRAGNTASAAQILTRAGTDRSPGSRQGSSDSP